MFTKLVNNIPILDGLLEKTWLQSRPIMNLLSELVIYLKDS